ncbi:MAG: hypothetical protein ACYTG0_47320 [Planctomycetota bacterium]|jgi:hypothetical protein
MYDPYREKTPYEVLEIPPESTAVQIRDRHTDLQRANQESGASVSDRSKRKQELEEAYNRLRVAGQRVKVDFYLLDPQIGVRQCQTIAEGVAKPNTNVKGLVKPRTIHVTHATMLSEPARLVGEPSRVSGMHPRSIEVAEQAEFPKPLAIRFDC